MFFENFGRTLKNEKYAPEILKSELKKIKKIFLMICYILSSPRRLLGRSNQSEEVATQLIRPLQGGNFLLEGTLLIDDLENELQVKIDTEGEEYDTTGGLAMARLGRIPKAGDLFVEDNCEFRIMAMDGKRVSRLLMRKIEQSSDQEIKP